MDKTIPFFAVGETYRDQADVFSRNLDRVFNDRDFVGGSVVKILEDEIASRTGATHAIATSNASDGLAISLKAVGIGPGDEVIVPAVTFASSASSVIHAGAVPVFADIDTETYGLDPQSVAQKITGRTGAIMPVDLFYQPARIPELLELAQRHNLIIVQDSAEALGMSCNGVHCGLHGLVGALSFFPTKTLGAFGDAGMLLTHDPAVASICRELRNHGRADHDSAIVNRVGMGARMDSVQATILLSRLESLDSEIARRALLAERYAQQLRQIGRGLRVPSVAPRPYPCKGVWYVYVIECDHRDELGAYLAAHGIGTETYYPWPLHLQPAFSHLGYRPGDLPVAERTCSRTLALPLYPQLKEDQVDMVCDRIAAFYGGRQ